MHGYAQSSAPFNASIPDFFMSATQGDVINMKIYGQTSDKIQATGTHISIVVYQEATTPVQTRISPATLSKNVANEDAKLGKFEKAEESGEMQR